ncbi:MAG: hypothetical protein IT445_07575 [Phycisphaeraceae bacterium]|nr:hypothetical protein [Phycisphaeraceae bacterium]
MRDSVFDAKMWHPGVQNPMSTLNWISPHGHIGWLSTHVGGRFGELIDIDTRQVLPASDLIAQGVGEVECVSHSGDMVYAEPALEHGTGVLIRPSGELVQQIKLLDRARVQFAPGDDALLYRINGSHGNVGPVNNIVVLQKIGQQRTYRCSHPMTVEHAVVSRDLSVVATVDQKNQIRIWRPPSPQVVRQFPCQAQQQTSARRPMMLRLSPNGDKLMAGTVKLDLDQPFKPREPGERMMTPTTRNGQRMMTGRFACNAVAVFDTAAGKLLQLLAPPDSELLQINTDGDAALFRVGDKLVVYAIPSGQPLRHYDISDTTDDEYYSEDLSTVIIRSDTHEMVYRLTESPAE